MSIFKELGKDFETNESEQATFLKLKSTRDWGVLKEVVERYILKLTYNLIVGTEADPGASSEELKAVRGFVRYWQKITKRVELELEKPKKNENS